MPSFDTISEWVLANLYVVGTATGAVVLAAILIVLLAKRRGRDAHGGTTMLEAKPVYPRLDLPTSVPAGTGRDEFEYRDASADRDASAVWDTSAYRDASSALGDAVTHTPGGGAAEAAGSGSAGAEAALPEGADDLPYMPPPNPHVNHVRDIVQDLIQGPGDITGAELRRLDLIRPERVLEVAAELDAGLGGRGKEALRTRLAQISRYAELLMPAEAAPDVFAADFGRPVPPTPDGSVSQPHDDLVGAAAERSYGYGAELMLDPELSLLADEPEPAVAPAPTPVIGEAAFIDAMPEPTAEDRPPQDQEEEAWQPTVVDKTADDWRVEAITEDEGPWQPAAPSDGADPWAAAVAEEAGTWGIAETEEAGAWEVADTKGADAVPAVDEAPTPDLLMSLGAAELGRLFASTDDKSLKLSIIDALETTWTPETMTAIQVCLDDADPEVQVHALEAAERLLGRL